MINPNDFRVMHCGRPVGKLTNDLVLQLKPIEKRTGLKNRALLLLHGFSSSPAVFRAILAELDYYDAIIAPALPGHASNIIAFAQVKPAEIISYCEAICEGLVKEYTHVDVLGLSLGGMIAAHLAARFKLNHLYLLAPAFDLHLALNRMLTITRFFKALGFKYLRTAAGDLCALDQSEITYRLLPLSVIIDLLTTIKQFKLTLPTCPTDLFLGAHDKIVASARVAQRFLHHPMTRTHWLENSAHILPLDNDKHTILSCIRNNYPIS